MTSIQGKIVVKNERNILYRGFYAKSDKDEIAAWKQEFKTILEIFNVHPADAAWHSLTAHYQTELHISVLAGVKRMHRDLLASNGQYPVRRICSSMKHYLPSLGSGEVCGNEYDKVHSLIFS